MHLRVDIAGREYRAEGNACVCISSKILLPVEKWGLHFMSMEDASDQGSQMSEEQYWLDREEKLSVQGNIAIKGTRNGLLLTLEPETPFSELLNALADRLAEAPAFFRGASLVVDTSRRALGRRERSQLENLLAYYQVSIMPVEHFTSASLQNEASQAFSFDSGQPQSALTHELQHPTTLPSAQDGHEIGETFFLHRTVRSGQAIHHAGNIIIMGDVNPGAEVVAGGDVIVWGVLRGMVHAGYPDNEQASVCSLSLAPVQLRIAHLLSRPPEGMDTQPYPEVATIRNGRIVVETWINGRAPRK
jgi:septum site-determining protein MinC